MGGPTAGENGMRQPLGSPAIPPRGAASPPPLLGQIIVAAEVQQAVDHVQDQLGPGLHPVPLRHPRGGLGRDDQLAREVSLAGVGEDEADDVRRPVVVEVAAVDGVDRRVIDDRDRDLGAADPLGLQDAAGDLGEAGSVRQASGRRPGVADLDDDPDAGSSGHQAVRCSGYLTRTW